MRKKLSTFFKIITTNKLLVIFLIIAAVLRFVGTNPGYNQFHSDEGISYSAAASMVYNNNLDPLRYDYPALVPIINYVIFQTTFIPVSWITYYSKNSSEYISGKFIFPPDKKQAKKILKTEIFGFKEINALFWGRYITALFSVGNVFLLYLLASKLFNKQIGLISAFLLTFNFKHIENSHIGLPDIYNAFVLLLSLLLTIRLLSHFKLKDYLLAGLGAGLFFSTKYQVFAFFPIILIHLYNSLEKNKIKLLKLFNLKIFTTFFIATLVFLGLNVYFFIHSKKALGQVHDTYLKYAMGKNQLNLYPLYYFYNIDYGFLIMIAILAGVVVGILKYRLSSLFLLSVVIPFVFIFFYYSNGGYYVRNFITITPIFFCFAGLFFFQTYKYLHKKFGGGLAKISIVLILCLSILLPAKNAIINSFYYTKPWNYDVLRDWEKKNLPKGSIVATHPFDPLPDEFKRVEFNPDGRYSLAEHREQGAAYALMNLDWAGNTFYFWMSFGLDKLDRIFKKPTNFMRNTFFGIAAEELFRYQVFSVTKPWQAAESALILAKIPKWPDTEMSKIKTFNFDKDLEGWQVFGKEKNYSADFIHDKSYGKLNPGSISLLVGSSGEIMRVVSKPIDVKSNHLYKIKAFLKSEKSLKSRERDGFLRVDFYPEKPNFNEVGIITAISSRLYETDEWVEKEVLERAPDSAKYLMVSFQISRTINSRFWIDDVIVDESKNEVSDITDLPPYNKKKIQLDLLYPHSHGNL